MYTLYKNIAHLKMPKTFRIYLVTIATVPNLHFHQQIKISILNIN